MERILDALERLPPGGELVALTPSYPAPLLSALAGGGYVCDAASMAGGWRVTIRRANAAAP